METSIVSGNLEARPWRRRDHRLPVSASLASAGAGWWGDRAGARPNLLEILPGWGGSPPFAAPVGVLLNGGRLWINLADPSSGHVLVQAVRGGARAEFLRTAAIGLALTTRPSLLQMLAIDLSGRELHLLESLPHTAFPTAADAAAARLSLRWLGTELRARRATGRAWPGMLLVVEDMADVEIRIGGAPGRVIRECLRLGAAIGIHVLAGAPMGYPPPRGPVAVLADQGDGTFEDRRQGRRHLFVAAGVPVVDLDIILRGPTGSGSRKVRMGRVPDRLPGVRFAHDGQRSGAGWPA